MAISFTGPAKRIEDVDLPRIGYEIGVGEDVIHAIIDVEAPKSGFDSQGRPRILFEPHVFYRNLTGAKRDQAVKAGLACRSWGQIPYGKESAQYGRLERAMAIDETAALKACSWGRGQILGENHVAAGYATPQAMVADFTLDEDNHLEAMIRFIKASRLDDELRVLEKLTRKATPDDCRAFVRGYNGPAYEKNGYHNKFAAAFNRWRGIRDTPWSPPDAFAAPVQQPTATTIKTRAILTDTSAPIPPPPASQAEPGFFSRLFASFIRTIGA